MNHFDYAVSQVNKNENELMGSINHNDVSGIEDNLSNLLFYNGVIANHDQGECQNLIDFTAEILSKSTDFLHAPSLYDILYSLLHNKGQFKFDKNMIKPLKENLASYNHDVKFWKNYQVRTPKDIKIE